MIKPMHPSNEVSRLRELASLELLDSSSEVEFDQIVQLASYITGCPIALISLIDIDRQWFKARVGLDAIETHRDISFCGHAILKEELFIVEDAFEDERFRANPLVTGDPKIRFYAGQPLVTSSGFRIGTLCTIDRVPKTLSEEQKRLLAALSEQAIKLIELRSVNRIQRDESASKTQFLANISHEIRTPLTAILGYGSIAQEVVRKENMGAKIVGFLENIERQSKHILSLVGNVLDLTKIESGRIEFDEAPFSVKELKRSIISLFELEAKARKIDLIFTVSEGVPQTLIADFTRVKQILINLVGNALKFTDAGEVVVRLTYRPSEQILQASVSDTGCGISPTQSARLFQPFSQGDATVGTKYGGTGLGLALSRELAQAMGGNLWIENTIVNQGSEFVTTLIAPESSMAVMPESLKSDAVLNTLRSIAGISSVLVVDDSDDNRFVFNHFLKSCAMKADEAESGLEALEKISRKNYDVIFLDMKMADENGFQVFKKIRRLQSKAKVVAFTAHVSREDQENYRAAGFASFLPKPFQPSQVADVLFDILVLKS